MASFVGVLAASLPESRNVLRLITTQKPSVYRNLGVLYGGMDPEYARKQCRIVHSCARGCVAFAGIYSEFTRCPKCDEPRYKKCRYCVDDCDCGRVRKPAEVTFYLSITRRLMWIRDSPLYSLLGYPHFRHQPVADMMYDIYDGERWQWFTSKMGPADFFVGLTLSSDGFDMFNWSGKSANPIFFDILNLPPPLRNALHVGLHMVAIDRGSPAAMQLLAAELRQLWVMGIEGRDLAVLKTGVVNLLMDTRGYEKVTYQQGAGSYSGCNKCDVEGTRFGSTQIYPFARR